MTSGPARQERSAQRKNSDASAYVEYFTLRYYTVKGRLVATTKLTICGKFSPKAKEALIKTSCMKQTTEKRGIEVYFRAFRGFNTI
jgi:hypothetical protein